MTKHVNNYWSSTIDNRGYGPMIAEDYRRLMEGHGFRVALAKPYPLCFKVTKVRSISNQIIFQLPQSMGHFTFKDVVEATHKVVYEAFDELPEKDRNAFLSEYRQRVEAAHISVRWISLFLFLS